MVEDLNQADQVLPLEQPAQPTEQPPEAVVPAASPPIIPIVPKPPLTFQQRWSAFLRWFKAPENIAVCAMAAVVLVLHIILINTPKQIVSTQEWIRQFELNQKDSTNPAPPAQYIFDEAHYIPEAIRFLHREGPDAQHGIVRSEHPPLSKWIIAAGIFVFGDNPVGWRVPSIVFSLASIFIFYFICRRLAGQEPDEGAGSLSPPAGGFWKWFRVSTFVPVLATFLFATENLSWVQAHMAMLDVFYVTFMLLGFLFYLRGNYLASGMMMGLSMLNKAMALLAILGIVIHWAFTRRSEILAELRFTWNALRGRKGVPATHSDLLGMVKFLVAIPTVWVVLLTLLEYPVSQQWANPIVRTWSMLSSHLSLSGNSTSGIASMPWAWLYYPDGLYYWYTPHYLGAIGWTVWALVMPAMALLIYTVIRRKTRGQSVAPFALFWFIGVYGLLIALELATNRYMYHFYFYPAVPVVCLAIAWCIWKLWGLARRGRKRRVAFMVGLSVYILATVATFVIMSPYGTNLITLPSLGG